MGGGNPYYLAKTHALKNLLYTVITKKLRLRLVLRDFAKQNRGNLLDSQDLHNLTSKAHYANPSA